MSDLMVSKARAAAARLTTGVKSVKRRVTLRFPSTFSDRNTTTSSIYSQSPGKLVVKILQSRPLAWLNLLLTFICFILAILALSAGQNRGFMEEYSILRLDTSNLGSNLVGTTLDAVDFNATKFGQEVVGATGQQTGQRNGDQNRPTGGQNNRGRQNGDNNAARGQENNGNNNNNNRPTTQPSTQPSTQPLAPIPASTIGGALGNAMNGLANGGAALLGGIAAPVVNQAFTLMQTAFDNLKTAAKKDSEGNRGIAKQVTTSLGVTDWYSLHVNSICQGNFETSVDKRDLLVTSCTSSPAHQLDSAIGLGKPFDIGPLTVDLSNTGLPQTVDQLVGYVNGILLLNFLFYMFSLIFSTLSLISTLGSLFLTKTFIVILINAILSTGAAAMMLSGSIFITAAGSVTQNSLKNLAPSLGLPIEVGYKFRALTWVTSVLMFIIAGYWILQLVMEKLRSKRDKETRELMGLIEEKRKQTEGQGFQIQHENLETSKSGIGVAQSMDY
ncbi:hypothetical protein CP533_1122 [Ophiocordyceps camponoti-saundersi (nom. inval.)]|nr:hypothetical protein CP533_1122 [Ophiocordyceps camponoti-saundersi (nom. inval.)]